MRFSTLVTAIAFSALVSGAALALDAAQPTPEPDARRRRRRQGRQIGRLLRQADVKTLHGKERKKFHHECMKAQ